MADARTRLTLRLEALIARAIDLRPGELAALAWAFAYFFCLLSGYYVLRPLRDTMGIAGGVENLQWLFTATFGTMLCAVPAFGWLVARFPRRRFLPVVYHFFVITILGFFAAFQVPALEVHVARVFFVWVSVYNLFVVSVFWSFMADLFTSDEGKRLFGAIAAGGTAGAMLGPTLTAALAEPLGHVNLLIVTALLLEAAVFCVYRLLALRPGGADQAHGGQPGDGAERAVGGSVLAGATTVARSPYLLAICLYLVLYTTSSTILYFQQATVVSEAFADDAARTRLFALIDLLVNVLTLATQLFLTARLFAWLGLGAGLALLPALTGVGFLALAVSPVLAVLVGFQGLRRASNYAIARPAREVLFTVLDRERKYKSKNFIDTVVYRGGDAASGWAYAGLSALGMGIAGIAALAVPLAAAWGLLGLYLGRRQARLAVRTAEGAAE